MSTPYIGFTNDSLKDAHDVIEGDEIHCDKCNGRHALQCAVDTATKEKSTLVMFYSCGDKTYLGAVAGKLVAHTKPDVSGRLRA